MNPITGLVAGLSDRLLALEHVAFAEMEVAGLVSWRFASDAAVKRWQRGKVQNQSRVVAGWQQDAERCSAALTQIGMSLLSTVDEVLYQTLEAELALVEAGLGRKKYAGVAAETLDALPRYVWLASSAQAWRATVAQSLSVFAGSSAAIIAGSVAANSTGPEMADAVYPAWRNMVGVAKGEIRMVEFGMVNGVRGAAIELVDQAADRR